MRRSYPVQLSGAPAKHGAEFISVDNLPFRTFFAQLARHHFHAHADAYITTLHVVQLGRHHWPFIQPNEGDSISLLLLVALWAIVHFVKAVHSTPTTQRAAMAAELVTA